MGVNNAAAAGLSGVKQKLLVPGRDRHGFRAPARAKRLRSRTSWQRSDNCRNEAAEHRSA
jgi:hypothetical protein